MRALGGDAPAPSMEPSNDADDRVLKESMSAALPDAAPAPAPTPVPKLKLPEAPGKDARPDPLTSVSQRTSGDNASR